MATESSVCVNVHDVRWKWVPSSRSFNSRSTPLVWNTSSIQIASSKKKINLTDRVLCFILTLLRTDCSRFICLYRLQYLTLAWVVTLPSVAEARWTASGDWRDRLELHRNFLARQRYASFWWIVDDETVGGSNPSKSSGGNNPFHFFSFSHPSVLSLNIHSPSSPFIIIIIIRNLYSAIMPLNSYRCAGEKGR